MLHIYLLLGKLTSFGAYALSKEPTPNAPKSPCPQAYTIPESNRANVWPNPHYTLVHVKFDTSSTKHGELDILRDLFEIPNLPQSLLPIV